MRVKIKNKKAFGLIETLIACAILIMITGSLLTINVITNRNIRYVRHRAQAYNLASEGIETVRQIRETNSIDRLESTAWNSFVCSGSNFTTPDIITSASYEIVENNGVCGGSGPRPRYALKLNNLGQDIVIVDNINNIRSATYKRKIKFKSSGIEPDVKAPASVDHATTEKNAMRVEVEVSWNNNGRDYSISVSEVLTNWKQGI